jgi:hypothetical protein
MKIMIPLFSETDFILAKVKDILPLECLNCHTTFYKQKRRIQSAKKSIGTDKCNFCSPQCLGEYRNQKLKITCKNCSKPFEKRLKEIKKTKNNFCSHSCATTYQNAHKTTGTKRSKLEIWLESQLEPRYPNMIKYNNTEAINSELDIYIPSLSLAFELNGIFHYEPIYGPEKLFKIQNNDQRKFQACIEYNIELCILDVSWIKHFKEHHAQKYLKIITDIIDTKLSTS